MDRPFCRYCCMTRAKRTLPLSPDFEIVRSGDNLKELGMARLKEVESLMKGAGARVQR